MAFSPDGTKIVSGSTEKTIKVWDAGVLWGQNCLLLNPKLTIPVFPAGTLELKAAKENAHNGYVMSVSYDKDGEKIVSGGQDGTIKVWDAGAGVELTPNCHLLAF